MPARPRGRIVAVEGASASGKTTVTEGLHRAGWAVVGEAYDRLGRAPDLGVPTPRALRAVETRLLAEEVRRSREALRRSAAGEDVVLDTATIGPATYSLGLARRDPAYGPVAREVTDELRRRIAAGRVAVPDRVVYLVASEDTRRGRAARSPRTHPAAMAVRHAAVGRFEYRLWRRMARAAPGAIRFVDASGGPGPVLRSVQRALAKPGRRLSPALVRAALAGAAPPGPRHR